MRAMERDNTIRALELATWKVAGPGGAAELLGVKATTLMSRIKKMRLSKPQE